MFCPKCGTLAFPDPSGVIDCTNYSCGYKGSTSSSIKGEDGRTIDMTNLVSTSKAETREYEVIKDSDKFHGVLTVGDYMCPKCDGTEVYSYLEQTRSSDEPETRMLTCKDCNHGWREY